MGSKSRYTEAMGLKSWRYRRFHASYLLAWFGLGLLLGLLAGRNIRLGFDAGLLFVGLSLTLGAFHARRWWSVPLVVLAGLCLGLLRGSEVGNDYTQYTHLFGKQVTLRGVMNGDAQSTGGGRQKITVQNVKIGDISYRGEVFVTLFGRSDLKRGDTVTVYGTLRDGFASYGASISSGRVAKIERTNDVVRDIRERFAKSVRMFVMEPMASLGLGFVVGQRSALPETLDEQLKVVGLTHIVVASGYNLTILVRFVMRLFSRYSRYLAFVGSLLMIFGFVMFSGLSPSMNRAVIVTVLSLLAWYVGRRFHPVLLVTYVASATAFYNPMYVWGDLGWYLSFFAFAGILIVAPLVIALLYRRRGPSSFEQLVIETLSAEVMALPLVALTFSAVPAFALLANVLVAPLIPVAMVLTALTGIIGMISATLVGVVALPTTVLIGYMIAVVEWIASLPVAQYHVELSVWLALALYVLLAVVCVVIQLRTKYNFRLRDTRLET